MNQINVKFTLPELQKLSNELWDVQDEGPRGEGWKSEELWLLIQKIEDAIKRSI